MVSKIDIHFSFLTCLEEGNPRFDIDMHCQKLLQYHFQLWNNKPLPNGETFQLEMNHTKPYFLFDNHFRYGSDSILHTYRNFKRKNIAKILEQIGEKVIHDFYRQITTIGGYIIFPKHMNSMNQRRGTHHSILDRFDLTLESIQKYYDKTIDDYPLKEVLLNDALFFDKFVTFKQYLDFFYLQDLYNEKTNSIRYFLDPSQNESPLPTNITNYTIYKEMVLNFIAKRNKRISEAIS